MCGVLTIGVRGLGGGEMMGGGEGMMGGGGDDGVGGRVGELKVDKAAGDSPRCEV